MSGGFHDACVDEPLARLPSILPAKQVDTHQRDRSGSAGIETSSEQRFTESDCVTYGAQVGIAHASVPMENIVEDVHADGGKVPSTSVRSSRGLDLTAPHSIKHEDDAEARDALMYAPQDVRWQSADCSTDGNEHAALSLGLEVFSYIGTRGTAWDEREAARATTTDRTIASCQRPVARAWKARRRRSGWKVHPSTPNAEPDSQHPCQAFPAAHAPPSPRPPFEGRCDALARVIV
ncbi:hypothetical protein BV20DRAFT_595996 [Pilatotrama ljubarskyi]|nr:hypothetical protein BV20DRAFT_595996 [Pilatotrama ljubarskyi]